MLRTAPALTPWTPTGKVRLGQNQKPSSRMGVERWSPASYLGETFDEFTGIPRMGGDILRLLGHGAGAWLGIYMGASPFNPTLVRVAGWVLGSGMAIITVLDAVSIVKRISGTHPPEA